MIKKFIKRSIRSLFIQTLITIIVFFLFSLCQAQSTDLLRLEYMRVPENSSGIKTSRYRLLANMPFKLKEDRYLIIGAEYNQFDVDYSETFPFDATPLKKFSIIDVNLGYITKWNENWRFIAILTPRLASNFTDGIIGDDFFFNCTATLWKEVKDADKPFRIVLGLTYNSTTGLPIPLPLINYNKRFHPKWSYTLGIPRMNFKYHPNEKNLLQLALLLDGYFMNVQNDIVLPNGDIGSKSSLNALVMGLEYQYKITKDLNYYIIAGKSIIQNNELRDDKRNKVYVLNDRSSLYFRTGVKVSIF